MHTMNNEESEYCLRWHKHFTNFAENFESLLANESLADVFFFIEGQLVKAHKVVLSFCSPYFQNLFKETLDKNPLIVLKDAKVEHIKMLLEFMYTGQVNIPQEALKPIMKIAQSLSVKGLADGVVDIEKLPEPENESPMSLIRPKTANHLYNLPSSRSPSVDAKPCRPLPAMYSTTPTSVHSVLSNALTMPSALSLTSPLSLPHLSSLPPNIASLASTLSIPQSISSFIPPHDIPQRDGCESPMLKRRRKHRRRSGEIHDSGDSDGRSSGSPGESVSNLHLPRIPATITPIGLHRQHLQHLHNNLQLQQQPRDLSMHSTQNHNSHINNHERSLYSSPHRDLPPTVKPPPPNIPGLLLHNPVENHQKSQDEPENLEHRPQQPQRHETEKTLKTESNSEEAINLQSNSPEENKSSPATSGRRSDESSALLRQFPKFGSDPESLASPAKALLSHGRLDETSSDNNHFSDDERDENTSGQKETTNERLSDSTPGPSTSRPHSEEAPPTPNFLGWPYSTEHNAGEDHFPNFTGDAGHGFWKNSFKGGLLAPYLGSPLGPLPHNPRGLASTFPGLYGTTGATPPGWGRRSNSPPGLGLPPHLRSNECSRCGRLYKTRKGLKHHIKNECGVEPRFQCDHCDWKFKQKAHLLRHVARKHTIS